VVLRAPAFADAGGRGGRNACVIALAPARIAPRVIALNARWKERLTRGFLLRLAMAFRFGCFGEIASPHYRTRQRPASV
jgi:hypothetical protein